MAGKFDPSTVAASEELRLLSFTSDDAFAIGTALRSRIQQHPSGRNAIIDIRAGAGVGQQLFFATTGAGTLPDNAEWARRKRAAVERWGKSTASLNLKWGKEGIPAFFGVSEADYAVHGGGFPVRVKGVETLVGTIVVSGLAQEDDHQVIVDTVTEYIQEQEKAAK
ncbi:hypothetical protein JCM8097_003087 [Rhodosporidiobolus ruineniae]